MARSKEVVNYNEGLDDKTKRDLADLQAIGQRYLDAADGFIIITDLDLATAIDRRRELKLAKGRAERFFKLGIDQAYDHYRYLLKQSRSFTDPIDKADREYERKIEGFQKYKGDEREKEILRVQSMLQSLEPRLEPIYSEQIIAEEEHSLMTEAKLKNLLRQSTVIKNQRVKTAEGTEHQVYDEYTCEVYDPMALLKSIVTMETPIEAVMPNEKFLNDVARKTKTHMPYDGCRIIKITKTKVYKGKP